MDTPLIPIAHYGVHTTPEGIKYLHQGSRPPANFINLKKSSPFEQRPIDLKGACPHLMHVGEPNPDRAHWDFFLRFINDPLVKHMWPVPKQRFEFSYYLNDPQNNLGIYLSILSKMSSPLGPILHPIDSLNEKVILQKLTLTNITPLILTGVQTHHQRLINRLATEAQLLPRKLFMTGASEMVIREPIQRITTMIDRLEAVDLIPLPMEQIGVAILRRFAREEHIDAPYVRREG